MQRTARGSGVLNLEDRSSAMQAGHWAAAGERVARTQRALSRMTPDASKEHVLSGSGATCLELASCLLHL